MSRHLGRWSKMKISELIQMLERSKSRLGDVEIINVEGVNNEGDYIQLIIPNIDKYKCYQPSQRDIINWIEYFHGDMDAVDTVNYLQQIRQYADEQIIDAINKTEVIARQCGLTRADIIRIILDNELSP